MEIVKQSLEKCPNELLENMDEIPGRFIDNNPGRALKDWKIVEEFTIKN